ncbi:MAG: V-type ATPase subunit [Ruminococcus sp.]|nr:V-type ATPase subunit [Candidatus Copronaster equi]
MSVSYSANAVLGKAHAMYSKKLTEQNYNDMVNCRSLNELVAYIKTRTSYSSAFDVAVQNITASQIQELLGNSLLNKIEILCKYEASIGENFYKYFIVENEIKQILTVIRLLARGTPEKYLSVLPAFFSKRARIDLFSFVNVRSFENLLDVLKDSDYEEILKPYINLYKQKDFYLRIEADLNRYLHSILLDIIKNSSTKKDKKEIHDLANYKFDMETISNIYRLIRINESESNFIKNYIDTEFTNFSQKEIDMLVNSDYARDMVRLIPNTFYKKDFAKVDYNYLEGATQKMAYLKFSKCFRYSTSPAAVMFSYIYLMENEVQNIVHIAEGIKNNIEPEKISAVLI